MAEGPVSPLMEDHVEGGVDYQSASGMNRDLSPNLLQKIAGVGLDTGTDDSTALVQYCQPGWLVAIIVLIIVYICVMLFAGVLGVDSTAADYKKAFILGPLAIVVLGYFVQYVSNMKKSANVGQRMAALCNVTGRTLPVTQV